MSKSCAPIGIFDSGIGGLTVAHALSQVLPNENIIYYGDTIHLPYGDKSAVAIRQYANEIVKFLLEAECKLILIACHSASAAAFDEINAAFGHRAPIVNVIDPVMLLLKARYAKKKIGLIGTRQTVHSRVYEEKIKALAADITLAARATYLLAPAIEEFGDHEMIDHLLKIYLSHETLQSIDALILACTHYPVIKHKISKHYAHAIELIDSALVTAEFVKKQLEVLGLMKATQGALRQFFVSDYTETFEKHAKLFFGDEIRLVQKML